MINVLLDPLPDQWEDEDGNCYTIDTDFRIGVQMSIAQADQDMTQDEKMATMAKLLFTKEVPPVSEWNEVMNWYMNGWYHDNPTGKKSEERLVDFDVDQWRIYAAFLQKYGIDLSTANMHYWAFMGLLTALTDTAYTRVMDIRSRKTTGKMDAEQRKSLQEAKAVYSLENRLTPEQQAEEDLITLALGGHSERERARIERFESYGKGGNEGQTNGE